MAQVQANSIHHPIDPYTTKEYAAEFKDTLKVAAKLLARGAEPQSVLQALLLPPMQSLKAQRAMHYIIELQQSGILIANTTDEPLVENVYKVYAYEYCMHCIASEHFKYIDEVDHNLVVVYTGISTGSESWEGDYINILRKIGKLLALDDMVDTYLWECLG